MYVFEVKIIKKKSFDNIIMSIFDHECVNHTDWFSTGVLED
jgi:hypothetical protein